uniref:7 transmembrane receptor (Rhodopsin family) n=1 Tax=Musca domestica TaxID=7370 RepID=T1PIK5_MUSDO
MSEQEVNEKIYDHRVLTDWSNVNNNTNGTMHYSKDMIFNDGHRLSITVYSILFVISTIGNSTVLYLLTKRRLRGPSRIDIMLMHLAIADLMVTFLLMPLEIAWAYTVQWKSTDFMCRLMSFFRVFGLYLSGFVLVCISIDRYYAILKPLKLSTNRGRIMLTIAWFSSVVCSLPQAYFFHLEEHPKVSGYFQCVTFHSFPSEFHHIMYQIATMCAMYACPLITFIYCYGSIYLEIYRKSQRIVKGIERFRRSNDDVLSRAKKRTLKMTITIVIVFLICWTPYYIIAMWYWFDKTSVDKVSALVSKSLFIFACTNSCMNPIVYGAFNIRGRIGNNASTMSNRHTSLYNRGDSSNQLPKHLLNLSEGSAKTGSTHINQTDTTDISINHKINETTTTANGCTEISNKVDEVSGSPVICINCVDSIELSNRQKS